MTTKTCIGYIAQTRTHFYMEWKIKDYLGIEREPGIMWTSPDFCLFDSTWHLKLHPEGTTLYKSEEYVVLRLGKVHPQTPFRISCTLGIKARDGSVYKFINFIETFEHLYLGSFTLLKRSDLLENKSILDDDGTATFFCCIRPPEDKGIDVASQTLNHVDHITLSQDFKNLFLSETCSDITIKVQEQEIRAHSQILAARCSVFESMFTHEMKEKKTGVVDVEDCEPAAFREFLSFLYSGEIEKMSSDNVIDVYAIANKYNIAGLKARCLVFMKETLCIGSFCDVFSMAIKYDENELIQCATEFFLHEGKRILKTIEWLTFVKEFPLQSNELFIKFAEHLSQ